MDRKKRKRIESLVLDTYRKLDPSGINGKELKDRFAGMDDKAFTQWVGRLKDGRESLRLEIVPFKNEPSLDDIESAAKVINLPLHSRVVFRHDGMDYMTRDPVPVGYVNIRRLQQVLEKKVTFDVNTSASNQITGQLAGDSDVAHVADEETYALTTMGANETLKEMMGPRSDNLAKKEQFYLALERDGFVRQDDILGDIHSQRTIGFLNVLLLGAGLWSDLVDDSYYLTAGLKNADFEQ